MYLLNVKSTISDIRLNVKSTISENNIASQINKKSNKNKKSMRWNLTLKNN